MDDLTFQVENEKSLDSFIHTVMTFSIYIGMEFGIEKCAMICFKRGHEVASNGVDFPDKS